ncbi:hypothetical protein [Anaerosporobacter sp.]
MKRRWTRIAKVLLFLFILITVIPSKVEAKKDSYANAKPRIVIDSFKVTDDAIVPGEEFDLKLVLYNPGRVYSANNILLTFTNNADTISVVYPDSDQMYIEKIGPGKKEEVTIRLKASSEIKTETVKFSINAVFSDGETSSNLNDMSLSLPVTKSSKFEIQNVSIQEEVYIGAKTRAHITYKNSGSDNFYNVTMHIEGEALDTSQQYSLGSLVAGKVSYAEAYIEFVKLGKQSINIYFTYEDIKGSQYTTEPYVSQVESIEQSEEAEKPSEVIDNTSSNTRGFIGKISVMVGIIVVGFFVITLIKRYKR